MLYRPLKWFVDYYNFMIHAFVGAERIFEVMDVATEPFDDRNAISMSRIEGQVTFMDVTFGYDPDKPAIKGISLDVAPGEMIGLLGKSGVGKITIINLICRFYDVNRGSLTINGVDIRKARLEDLRSQIGDGPSGTSAFQRYNCRKYRLRQAGGGLRRDCSRSNGGGSSRVHHC